MTTTVEPTITSDADTFAEHLFGAANHTLEIMSAYIGDRLGWYRALAEASATPDELAQRTGTHVRYTREWLEQQAVVGWVDVTEEEGGRRYQLSPAAAEVLTDEHSLLYLAPLARMLGVFVQMPELLDAYRSGGGVSWQQFGADARESQADMNRPWFEHELPGALAGTRRVDRVLRRPGAKIADIGFGGGWSSIAIARAYPDATVHGFDIDEASVEMARRNAFEAGVADRVTFTHADAGTIDGSYDAVFFFECVHDMPRPVEVLAAARRMVRPDGVVVVMDEAVGDEFTAPGDDVERLMYGLSLMICLPDGMAHQPSAGTGTVFRPRTLRRYAQEAGFRDIDVLPIEDFGFWRFYQLHL
ncbi:MAG TPA: class I SAM-dependent methyltransferase [Euzebyales bacterium]